MTRPGRLGAAMALAAYVALAVLLFGSAWRDPFRVTVGIGGDPELFMWLLSWTPFSISHGLNPLLTDYLNYPSGANLMWNTVQLAPGLLLWPLLAAFGPVLTFNALMTLALALSAWCAFLAVRAIVGDSVGAFAGGLLYGFSPYMLGHALGHPNFVICLFPPLNLLLLYELLVRQRRAPWLPGALLGVLAAAQLVTNEEILFTTALFDALGVALLAALAPAAVRARLGHALRGLATALLVCLALAAVPLATQFLGPQRVLGEVRAPDFYVDDLLTFIVPGPIFWLAPAAAVKLTAGWSGNAAEWNGYLGLPLAVLLAGLALFRRRDPVVRWAALLGVVIAICSLGPHLHLNGHVYRRAPLPWAAVQALPLFRDILPGRLMLYFFLVAAVAVGVFAAEVRRAPAAGRRLLGAGALALAALPLLPALPWPATERPLPGFFQKAGAFGQVPSGSVVLVAPFSTDPGIQARSAQETATHPMYWQAAAGMSFRMPSGYMRVPGPDGATLNGPPPTTTSDLIIRIQEGEPAPPMTDALRTAMAGDFQHWRVRAVIVGPMQNQAEEVRLFTDYLGRPPEQHGDVYVWWDL